MAQQLMQQLVQCEWLTKHCACVQRGRGAAVSAICVLGRSCVLGRCARYDSGDSFTLRRSVACCTTQCHSQLHKEREADNDRSDREAAASARISGGVELASGEVEACR